MNEKKTNANLSLRTSGLLAIAIFGWGISWPFLKIALSEIPPWTFRGLIAPTAALSIIFISLIVGDGIKLPRGQWGKIAIAGVLNITIWHVFSAFGIRLLGGGQASIIAYTMPLWAVTFSVLFIKEKTTILRTAGLVIGMIGLGVLFSGELGILESAPEGAVYMLIAAISWGGGTVVQKRIKWKIPALSQVVWQLLIGGIPITILAIILESPDWGNVSHQAIGSTIFVLICPIIIAWFAWFKAIEQIPVSICSVSTLLVPILGVISSHLILGEPIGWRDIVSLILICSSLALVMAPTRSSN